MYSQSLFIRFCFLEEKYKMIKIKNTLTLGKGFSYEDEFIKIVKIIKMHSGKIKFTAFCKILKINYGDPSGLHIKISIFNHRDIPHR